MITKLCMTCFRKFFGDAKPQTFTWSRQCHMCHTPTPAQGLLIKADITASSLKHTQ